MSRAEDIDRLIAELMAEKASIERASPVPWPRRYVTHLYGDIGEEYEFVDFCDKAGWDYGSDEANNFANSADEIMLEFLVYEDGTTVLDKVDGKKLSSCAATDSVPGSSVA